MRCSIVSSLNGFNSLFQTVTRVSILAILALLCSLASLQIQIWEDDSEEATIGIQKKRGFPIAYLATAPGLTWAQGNLVMFLINTALYFAVLTTIQRRVASAVRRGKVNRRPRNAMARGNRTGEVGASYSESDHCKGAFIVLLVCRFLVAVGMLGTACLLYFPAILTGGVPFFIIVAYKAALPAVFMSGLAYLVAKFVERCIVRKSLSANIESA